MSESHARAEHVLSQLMPAVGISELSGRSIFLLTMISLVAGVSCSSDRLSTARYRADANRICQKADRDLARALQRQTDAYGHVTATVSTARRSAYLPLTRLKPPKELARGSGVALRLLNRELELMTALADSKGRKLSDSDVTFDASLIRADGQERRAWKRLGVQACALAP